MSTDSNEGDDPAIQYWRKHFSRGPTPLERRLFRIARRHLSPSDPYMFFFALIIHVCSLVYLDEDEGFMADAGVSRDLAKQMRTNFEALSRIIPLLTLRLQQLEFLAEDTEDKIRRWERHEKRLSIWQIKPQELPVLSLLLVNGLILLILASVLLLVAP